MIIDTSTTIAYKCSSCGAFQFTNVSLFEISNKKRVALLADAMAHHWL
ncbi:hypothetical protein [Acetivibrio straminisolvens]|nr:hypothetical protein [Acetivibrio straminisolvens]